MICFQNTSLPLILLNPKEAIASSSATKRRLTIAT